MFQSAPHFSSEANLLIATNSPMIFLVSIRASLQQRGELSGSAEKEINISFQSAPHFSSEANHPRWMGLPAILQFQSAPHFSSEANTREKIVLSRQLCFNPRLTSAARRTFHPLSILRKKEFQSAPHFSSEANSLEREESEKLGKFQSAPHFSSEANAIESWQEWHLSMFQSAPHFSSEANEGLRVDFLVDCLVSIRASLQQRGEHSTCGGCETWGVFQSAPHFSSEANLPAQTVAVSAARFQSAPHFSSEANASHEVRRRNAAVSIRASLQQRGERRSGACRTLTSAFQSAPHFSSEANVNDFSMSQQGDVSIRASLQQRGEPRLGSQ